MRNYIRDRDPVQQANPIQRILAMSTSITQPAIFRTETKFEERQTCVTFTIQLKVNEVTIIINFKFQCNKSLLKVNTLASIRSLLHYDSTLVGRCVLVCTSSFVETLFDP